MACNLPHTVEQLQMYVKNQTDKDDTERQEAIVEVIKKFELAKACKQRLRTRYRRCKYISEDKKAASISFRTINFAKMLPLLIH